MQQQCNAKRARVKSQVNRSSDCAASCMLRLRARVLCVTDAAVVGHTDGHGRAMATTRHSSTPPPPTRPAEFTASTRRRGPRTSAMLEALKTRIASMGYPLPIADKMQKLESVVPPAEWKSAAEGVYAIMCGHLPQLLAQFLRIKTQFGHPTEKELYQGMSVEDLVTRMLTKRPLCFFEESDVFM